MAVDVVIEDARWSETGLESLAERAVGATLSFLSMDPGRWEIVVLGCDDARIAELNATFREKPAPTNVLSWPSEDRAPQSPGMRPEPPQGDPELGDIALAWETCVREAAEAARPVENHVLHLIVHGTLHLLGYDHIDDSDARLMESSEIAILETLGVPDPY